MPLYEGTYRLDQVRGLATIQFQDLTGPAEEKNWAGLYFLEGDTLLLCGDAVGASGARAVQTGRSQGCGYVSVLFYRD